MIGRRDRVLVVGAGPAGSVAATLLARAGCSVTVMAPDRRVPQTAESLPTAIVRLLERLDLPSTGFVDGTHPRITGTVSRWAGQLRNEDGLRHPEGGGFRVDRPGFERELRRAALEAGAVARRQRLGWLERSDDGRWRVGTNRQDDAFDLVVDASGPAAVVARRLAASRSRSAALVAVSAVGPAAVEPGSSRSFVESAAGGWWYAARLPCGRPVVVFHTSPTNARALRRDRRRWWQALAETETIVRAFPEALWRDGELTFRDATPGHSQAAVGDGWLACGDAVLRFDPLSSQGLLHAVATAEMAAGVVLGRDRGGARYRDRLRAVESIYRRRRRSYLEAAANHHGSLFWQRQLEGEKSMASWPGVEPAVAGPVRERSDKP